MKPTSIVGAAIVIGVVAIFMLAFDSIQKKEQLFSITTFEECAAAGYPIMESYPEQCRTPDGRTFVHDISGDDLDHTEGPMIGNGCAVGGCSNQLCVSADEVDKIFTTCEYRAEYACYQTATCEQQSDGKCGWTETAELTQCLANPPALDADLESQPM